MDSTLEAECEVERFSQACGREIVLRLGMFYGPQAPSTCHEMEQARKGLAPATGPGDAYLPMI